LSSPGSKGWKHGHVKLEAGSLDHCPSSAQAQAGGHAGRERMPFSSAANDSVAQKPLLDPGQHWDSEPPLRSPPPGLGWAVVGGPQREPVVALAQPCQVPLVSNAWLAAPIDGQQSERHQRLSWGTLPSGGPRLGSGSTVFAADTAQRSES
jgi:hypothetical protein